MSALASAITSWTEFIDTGRKLERYSTAIREIKKLIAWWESLSDVDQSSVPNITYLVQTGERIIMGELSGWGAGKKRAGGKENDEDDDDGNPQAGQAQRKQLQAKR